MEQRVYPVSEAAKARPRTSKAQYEALTAAAQADNAAFWAEQAQRIDWMQPFSQVKDVHWSRDDVRIRWFEDGTLNVCYNCVDRHLASRGDQTAIIWEGDDPTRDAHVSYRELHERVCRMANVLKQLGVSKGDRVTLYMPMIVDAAVAMLACARIGAIHSVVFGGFSPEALAGRILDCASSVVITADEGVRGVVMHMANLNRMQREDNRVTVGAGVTMPSLLRATKEAGLAGLEKKHSTSTRPSWFRRRGTSSKG